MVKNGGLSKKSHEVYRRFTDKIIGKKVNFRKKNTINPFDEREYIEMKGIIQNYHYGYTTSEKPTLQFEIKYIDKTNLENIAFVEVKDIRFSFWLKVELWFCQLKLL